MDRRSYLRALGAVGATLGLAGCSEDDPDDRSRTPSTASGTPPIRGSETVTPAELRSEFGTVVNVADEGADTGGEEPVGGLVEKLSGHDTLLYFPPGRYRIDRATLVGQNKFGLLGKGATLVPGGRSGTPFLAVRRVSDFHLQGFRVDSTARNTAAWIHLECTGGENVVQNYAVEGFGDVVARTYGFTLLVQGSATSLTLADVDLGAGARDGIATFVFPQREFPNPKAPAGSLTFRNCVMKGWGAEGLYASAHSGPLAVVGGEYANNGIAQVRIGGGDAPHRAVVRDVTVNVTHAPKYAPEGNRVFRGIWLKEGDRATIENCDVTLRGVTASQTPGAIVVNRQFGRATIRDTTVDVDVARPALSVERPAVNYDPRWMPSLDRLPPKWGVRGTNLTLRGSGGAPVVDVRGRAGCSFENVTARSRGARAHGYRFEDSPGTRIVGGSVHAARFPVLLDTPDAADCLLHLSDVELATELQKKGVELDVAADRQFCLTPATGPDGDGEWLGLTRTVVRDPPGTGTIARGEWPPVALFGRRTRGE